VSHNRARTVGGGLASENATLLSLTNVTISGNRGRGGGGIGGYGRFKLLNVTIAANRAPRGAGVLVTLPELSTVSFRNVLLAGNGRQNCAGALTALGHNLDADGSCALAGPGDLSRVDPLLGPLASNGGPTLTHALLPGSPAIDAGDDADCPTRDQRGLPRQDLPGVGSAVCDIGAFERQPDER
jgi:hypothetical protein